jgi:hypothetical protein
MWLNLIAYGWETVSAGVLLAATIGIFTGPGDKFSCAPTDSEEWAGGDAWDRGHDQWIDEQNEVA